MRKIPIKRKIGFLQRENGSRNGEDFYFSRSYRVRNITYYLDSLFNLPNATMPYAYMENNKNFKNHHSIRKWPSFD